MSYTANDKLDVDISQVTGLETYKGLYYFYPNLMVYIELDDSSMIFYASITRFYLDILYYNSHKYMMFFRCKNCC